MLGYALAIPDIQTLSEVLDFSADVVKAFALAKSTPKGQTRRPIPNLTDFLYCLHGGSA